MKKRDFKKLIITGIASGALLASQTGNADNQQEYKNENGTYLAAGGCGANSCAGKPVVNGADDSTTNKGKTGANKAPSPEKESDVSDNSTTNQGNSGCAGKNSCSGKTGTTKAPSNYNGCSAKNR